jgi:hypothetical protein
VTHRESSPVVVYVDSDPVVLAHARAPLAGNDSGLTIVDDDIRAQGRILGHPRTRRVAPGSFVILSHRTSEGHPADIAAKKEETWAKSATPMAYRSRDEILRFFNGLDLVEPGLTTATRWREESPDPELDAAGGWTLAGRRPQELDQRLSRRTTGAFSFRPMSSGGVDLPLAAPAGWSADLRPRKAGSVPAGVHGTITV